MKNEAGIEINDSQEKREKESDEGSEQKSQKTACPKEKKEIKGSE